MNVNSRDPLQNIIPFRIKGVEIGRFDGSGNLGIGTATTTATAVRLDISGGAVRVNSGSAANTALTTVGRIGVNLTTSPTVDLDVSGAARVNSGAAANTALTTTGRIGVNLTTSPTVDLDVSGAARVNSGSAANTALTTVGRIGVNTATPTMDLEVNGSAKIGYVIFDTNTLYDFTSHTFTNAGTTGISGPTLTSVRTAYSSASWAQNSSYLDMSNNNGIQLWTVPATGSYTIRAVGAAGGNPGTYGKGRDIQTTTTLTKGEVIRILVGQQGVKAPAATATAGGGGGTFVVRGTQTPIIVAGGGGGRSEGGASEYLNSNASSTTSGNKGGDGAGSNNGAGGTNGGGGVASALTYEGGGGGGLLTNGTNSPAPNVGYGGASFVNGGVGGLEIGYNNRYGGFGGGGGSPAGGGGGGGYSGGGGGGHDPGWSTGGGGGSFAISTMTDYGATNTGHGSVTITLLVVAYTKIGVNTATPTVDLDVSGSVKITGNVDMSSTGKIVNLVTPTATQEAATKGYVDGAIPIGGIIMWSGTIATIPSNWRLCDGSNNTPNLTNKFIIGAIIDASSVAQTNITVVNTITGGTKDAVVVQHTHTATSSTENPLNAFASSGYVDSGGGAFERLRIGNVNYAYPVSGSHSHTITVAQEGVSGTNQNLPPYYALAFIMRIS